jgi:DNA polymerase III subunit gamma/tau
MHSRIGLSLRMLDYYRVVHDNLKAMTRALYRTHRPKTLGGVVGQETNIEILQNAARYNRFGHAYLFYGPRGTGKTTTARLLAKLLNCQKRIDDPKFAAVGEPCNVCARCLEVDDNNSLDVVELDAASNRGIDEIRAIKEHINLSPINARYKVYIIDEAHMLTGAAFNALLKTLEEPPAHGVIILATTEFEKVPATIVSRAQRFLFRKIPKKAIASKLKEVAKSEDIEIDPAALEIIASAGDGSMRDAISLLDQLAAYKKRIDVKTVEEITGRVGLKTTDDLASATLKKNAAQALSVISRSIQEGANTVQLTRDAIHYLRKILTLKLNPSLKIFYEQELTNDEILRLEELGAISSKEYLIASIRAFIRAYTEMRYSPFSAIPLEIAIAELTG